MFLPVLWDHLLHQFLEADDPQFMTRAEAKIQRHELTIARMTETYAQHFSAVQEQMGVMRERVQK